MDMKQRMKKLSKILDGNEEQIWEFAQKYKRALNKGQLLSYAEIYENLIKPMSVSLFLSCNELGIFQIFSREFIDELSKEIKKLKAKTIIEVGAGDGNLSRALQRKGVDSKPTDNYNWKKRGNINYPKDVEKIDFKKALKKYNPELVIICWEELGMPFTEEILKHPSVKWVIWIGEGLGGCCGNDSSLEKLNHTYIENKYCLARTDMGQILHTCVYLFKK